MLTDGLDMHKNHDPEIHVCNIQKSYTASSFNYIFLNKEKLATSFVHLGNELTLLQQLHAAIYLVLIQCVLSEHDFGKFIR